MNVLDQHGSSRFHIYNADCADALRSLPSESIHYSIYSPPFASLYVYSASIRDFGNCRTHDEFHEHFGFLLPELLRALKPGRLMSLHCMNLPSSKARDGVIGLVDFRGILIRACVEAGWIYHSEVCIWTDPVTSMQRTKALGLLHKTIRKDSSMSRNGLPDYLVTFRKPGENDPAPTADAIAATNGSGDRAGAVALHSGRAGRVAHTHDDFPVEMWQRYASPVWATAAGVDDEGFVRYESPNASNPDDRGINRGDTLTAAEAREEDDEKHLCALQLPIIRRALRLWTNENDVVLSPFAGIGSEGYAALGMKRRYIGVELKRSYYQQAVLNLRRAESAAAQPDLFDLAARPPG